MSSGTLCKWVRIAAIAVAGCIIFILGYIVPSWANDLRTVYPEFAHWYWPWLLFLWAAGIPCLIILAYIWKISGAVQREEVFTVQAAGWVRTGALLLFGDVGFFFAGNFLLLVLEMSHPGILLISLIIDVLGISMALGTAILSRYMLKAAALQEMDDGMI